MTAPVSAERLRLLAGGLNTGIEPVRPDRESTAPYRASGLLKVATRFTNTLVYTPTPPGRDMLEDYRAAVGTVVAGIVHGAAVGAPRYGSPCQACTDADPDGYVQTPCPVEVAYWPQLHLPTAQGAVAELIGVYEKHSPTGDDGLYARLQAHHGSHFGDRLYQAANYEWTDPDGGETE